MKYVSRINTLIILIQSLSKAEKRYFQLCSNLQGGEKVYLQLFGLIVDGVSADKLYDRFLETNDHNSFEMAIKHLYSVLLECLAVLYEKKDIQSRIFKHITKGDILFERELSNAALTELDKAKKLATAYENDSMLLLIRRTELKYLRALGFVGINEQELLSKHMKINDVMKYSRTTNMHIQLYDTLKHRIINKEDIRSDKQKAMLNDLVLSELNLISSSSYSGFEAHKLHLLFQATYYLNTSNYKSATRLYQELIYLFEEHKHLILNPPIYYLSALTGILDSLHAAGLYEEMPFFISKMKEIYEGDYSTEFTHEVGARLLIYELTRLLGIGCLSDALALLNKYEDSLLKKDTLLSTDIQLRIYLYSAITYLSCNELVKASKTIKKIFCSDKVFHTFPLYKTARLIRILIQTEIGNYDFFENEINSIKRNMHYEKHVHITEELIFKFVRSYPLPIYKKTRNKLWLQYKPEIDTIRSDKYEKQLLKIFDVLAWIESKLTNSSFEDVIRHYRQSLTY